MKCAPPFYGRWAPLLHPIRKETTRTTRQLPSHGNPVPAPVSLGFSVLPRADRGKPKNNKNVIAG
jgi:hypothetical protein